MYEMVLLQAEQLERALKHEVGDVCAVVRDAISELEELVRQYVN